MLGRRKCQYSISDLPVWARGFTVPDSFTARIGVCWSRVSHDAGMAAMCRAGKGHLSISPSLLGGVHTYPYSDDLSDREAAYRVRFGLCWTLGMGLPRDDGGFDLAALSRFRGRLAAQGQARYAFDALLRHGLRKLLRAMSGSDRERQQLRKRLELSRCFYYQARTGLG